MARTRRTSTQWVESQLRVLKDSGVIHDYSELEFAIARRWRIETIPTRYDAYHNPGQPGVIVLTSREVAAFTEGVWAAQRFNPVRRAGTYP